MNPLIGAKQYMEIFTSTEAMVIRIIKSMFMVKTHFYLLGLENAVGYRYVFELFFLKNYLTL